MERPTRITIAAILMALTSLYSIVAAVPLLARGAAEVNAGADSPPYFILVVALIAGVAGLVAAYGLWRNQRWGKILTIVLSAINGLSALPGVFFAPTTALWYSAIGTVALSVLIIVLVLWPAPRLAPAQA
jgi:hypothetical protein